MPLYFPGYFHVHCMEYPPPTNRELCSSSAQGKSLVKLRSVPRPSASADGEAGAEKQLSLLELPERVVAGAGGGLAAARPLTWPSLRVHAAGFRFIISFSSFAAETPCPSLCSSPSQASRLPRSVSLTGGVQKLPVAGTHCYIVLAG